MDRLEIIIHVRDDEPYEIVTEGPEGRFDQRQVPQNPIDLATAVADIVFDAVCRYGELDIVVQQGAK